MAAKSILLPNVDEDKYRKWVEEAVPLEPYVNGLWFSIIRHHFDEQLGLLQYSINPELRLKKLTTGGFSDLLLVKNNFTVNPPSSICQVIIEGKSDDAHNNFTNTFKQLVGYAKDLNLNTQSGWCYLIAAVDTRCMFWRYLRYDIDPVQIMKVAHGSNGLRWVRISATGKEFPESKEYSLVDQDDQYDIAMMLEWIKAHPCQAGVKA